MLFLYYILFILYTCCKLNKLCCIIFLSYFRKIVLEKMTGPTIQMTGLEPQQQQQQSKLSLRHKNYLKKNQIKNISVLELLCAIIQCYLAYIILHIFHTFVYYFIRDFYFMIFIAVCMICIKIMYHKLILF